MFGDKHHTRFINNQKQSTVNNLYKKQIMRHFSEDDNRKKNCPTSYDSLYVMFITFTGLV